MSNKTVTSYLKCTSIVTYKTPVYSDGSIGHPQIEKKFTTESKKQKAKTKKKKTTTREIKIEEGGEETW